MLPHDIFVLPSVRLGHKFLFRDAFGESDANLDCRVLVVKYPVLLQHSADKT